MSAWITFNYIDVSLICVAMSITKSLPNLNFFPMLLKGTSLIIFNLKLDFRTTAHDHTLILLAFRKSCCLKSLMYIYKSWTMLFFLNVWDYLHGCKCQQYEEKVVEWNQQMVLGNVLQLPA